MPLQQRVVRGEPGGHGQVAHAEEGGVQSWGVEDLLGLLQRAEVFELRDAQGLLVAAPDVVGGGVEPPGAGAGGGAEAAAAARGKEHAGHRALGVGRAGHVRDEDAVGSRVEDALQMAAARVGNADEGVHPESLGDDDRAVGRLQGHGAVLHVGHHEVEAGPGQKLDGLQRGDLDPGADEARVGVA